MKSFLRKLLGKVNYHPLLPALVASNQALEAEILTNRFILGQMLAKQQQNNQPKNIRDAEFQVFSQWGDDGIIQWLINTIDISNTTFIEFGVEDYCESNTRFLLMNNNWRGLIIDGSEKFMQQVRNEPIYWRHDLTAVGAFITKENINDLFFKSGFEGPIGLLSVDIDGNDYYVWEAIHCVDPDIVIVEYNAVFGNAPVSVPYHPSFYRQEAHYSNLVFGCGLMALCHLAEKKGYALVGCNLAGNNGYFVKKEKLNGLRPLTFQEAFVESRFRESRDKEGNLTFIRGKDRQKLIENELVYHVISGKTGALKEFL